MSKLRHKKAKAAADNSHQETKDNNFQSGAKTEDAVKGSTNSAPTEEVMEEGYDMLDDDFVEDMLQGYDHDMMDDYVESPLAPNDDEGPEPKIPEKNKKKEKQQRKGFWRSKGDKDKKNNKEDSQDVGLKVDDGYMGIAKDFCFRILDISGISGKLTGPTEK